MLFGKTEDLDTWETLQPLPKGDSSSNDTLQEDITTAQCTYTLTAIKNFVAKLPSLGNNDNPVWFMERIKRLPLFDSSPWLLQSASTLLQSASTLQPNQGTCLFELIGKIQGKLPAGIAKQVDRCVDLPALFNFFTEEGETMAESTERPLNMTLPVRSAKERPRDFILRSIEQISIFMSLPPKDENPFVTKFAAWLIYDSLQRDYPHVLRSNATQARMFYKTVFGYQSLAALQCGLLKDWSRVPAIPPNYG